LTREEVNEIADAPAGSVLASVRSVHDTRDRQAEQSRMGVHGATVSAATNSAVASNGQPKLEVKSVSGDGKVTFQAKQETESKA
jgi:hypothetical protein